MIVKISLTLQKKAFIKNFLNPQVLLALVKNFGVFHFYLSLSQFVLLVCLIARFFYAQALLILQARSSLS